jgi:2-C-methyl-D-erythritol 4-phosphate cytidylyltransferase
MRYWLVMPAAGAGQRFGAQLPKQYAQLAGRTVIEWALAPFLADVRCVEVTVVLAGRDPHWAQIAARLGAAGTGARGRQMPRLASATGGAERSRSVRNGLAALAGHAGPEDWILVHDAVRPCLDPEDLERLLEALDDHPIGGLLAAPVADTLKRAGDAQPAGEAEVAETVERAALWRALTPQMFRYGRLCAALDEAHAAGRTPTDEAQALEWQGEHPRLIEGSAGNLKITSNADLALAAEWLAARAGAAAGALQDFS